MVSNILFTAVAASWTEGLDLGDSRQHDLTISKHREADSLSQHPTITLYSRLKQESNYMKVYANLCKLDFVSIVKGYEISRTQRARVPKQVSGVARLWISTMYHRKHHRAITLRR